MWRKLTSDEQTMLLANYRFGAYMLRFVMGLWLVFITLYGTEGVKQLLENLRSFNYAGSIGVVLGLCVVGLCIYVPCYLIRNIGTEEI